MSVLFYTVAGILILIGLAIVVAHAYDLVVRRRMPTLQKLGFGALETLDGAFVSVTPILVARIMKNLPVHWTLQCLGFDLLLLALIWVAVKLGNRLDRSIRRVASRYS